MKALRARIDVSRAIRRIEFTETMKRRLIDEVKDAVDAVQKVQREVEALERQINPKIKAEGCAEAEGRGEEESPQEAEGHQDAGQGDDSTTWRRRRSVSAGRSKSSSAAKRRPSRRKRSWSKPTSVSSFQLRRSTRTAACSSSI
jgi:Skp family chaperone for outer membrane proteins